MHNVGNRGRISEQSAETLCAKRGITKVIRRPDCVPIGIDIRIARTPARDSYARPRRTFQKRRRAAITVRG